MKVRTAGMALTVCLSIFLAPSSQGEAPWSLWSEEELASKVRQAAPIGLALELLGLEDNVRLLAVVGNGRTTLFFGKVPVTPDNREKIVGQLARRMQIIKEEIGRRGLTTVAGEYSLEWNSQPTDECRPSVNDLATSVGNFTITQSSIDIEVRNPAGEVLGGGVVVASSLAIKIGSAGRGGVSSIYWVATAAADGRLDLTYLELGAPEWGFPPITCKIGAFIRRTDNK